MRSEIVRCSDYVTATGEWIAETLKGTAAAERAAKMMKAVDRESLGEGLELAKRSCGKSRLIAIKGCQLENM